MTDLMTTPATDLADAGRVAILHGLDAVERVVDTFDVHRALGRDVDPATLITALRAAITAAHEAHRTAVTR